MIANVPTKIVPIWFIEQWKKENSELGSSLDIFITRMIKDWELVDKELETKQTLTNQQYHDLT